uniref:Uncharacterized protein n=1 Tax=Nelumbo nucifera TaxID=4432 RepID=A0A822YXG0_NELNU|nr:TPA_asm: hypothetical protein HUJ06_006851 [Nelumbo nucifera]
MPSHFLQRQQHSLFTQAIIFWFVENRCITHWLTNGSITSEHAIRIPLYGKYYINFFRVVWRMVYVVSEFLFSGCSCSSILLMVLDQMAKLVKSTKCCTRNMVLLI